MSLKMAWFHSFSWTDNIPLYMKTILKAVQPPRQKKKCEPSEKKLCVSVTFLLTQTDVLSSYAGQLSVRENE